MLDGCARRARAELRTDRRRKIGVDQRVGHIPDDQWSEASRRRELLELAVFTPGDGTAESTALAHAGSAVASEWPSAVWVMEDV
jgi:hypothetical protein